MYKAIEYDPNNVVHVECWNRACSAWNTGCTHFRNMVRDWLETHSDTDFEEIGPGQSRIIDRGIGTRPLSPSDKERLAQISARNEVTDELCSVGVSSITIIVGRDNNQKLVITMTGCLTWTFGLFSIASHHVYERSGLYSIKNATNYGVRGGDEKLGSWKIAHGNGIRMRKPMSDVRLEVFAPIGSVDLSSAQTDVDSNAKSSFSHLSQSFDSELTSSHSQSDTNMACLVPPAGDQSSIPEVTNSAWTQSDPGKSEEIIYSLRSRTVKK